MRVRMIKDKEWYNVVTYFITTINGYESPAVKLEDGTHHVKAEWEEEDRTDNFPTIDKTENK